MWRSELEVATNYTVLAKLLNSGLDHFNCLLEVCLPDVTAINNTSRENLFWSEVLNDWTKLLWVADEVDMQAVCVLQGRIDGIEVVYDITEVSCNNELWAAVVLKGGKLLVGGLEGIS